MFAAAILSLWTALLFTATFVALFPSLRKSAPSAATISSTRSHAAEEPPPSRSLSRGVTAAVYCGAGFAFYSITASGFSFRRSCAVPLTISTSGSPGKSFSTTRFTFSPSRWSGYFQFLTRWVLIRISRDIEFDLRNDLFDMERLSYSYYQRNLTGDIMARATNDLNAVRMLLGPAIMYSANTHRVYRRRFGLHCKDQPA